MSTKTHEVLDLHYHPDEGQGCFAGTLQECEEFAATQTPHFMYKVVPMLKEEIEAYKKLEERESSKRESAK